MLYTLQNEQLTVTLSDLGAEVVSVKGASGCEYIWQADPKYWAGKAPLLFPICGRLTEGRYTYGGKTYEMNLHGFCRKTVFAGEKLSDSAVRFTLSDTEETRAIYPFSFALTVDYTLEGNTIYSSLTVENTGKELLPVTMGLHPGFNVPLDTGSFEDWYVEFSEPCSPDKLIFSDTCYLTGKKVAFPLENGRRLLLRHDLFDNDAIFLSRAGQTVTLRSDKSERSVVFSFPEFPYLGFWHAPKTDAPYVCIEPWCGLPAYDGEIDDFATKCDLFRLSAGDGKKLSYSICFG